MEAGERGRLPAWLQKELFDRRIVMLTGPLDDARAGEAAASLMALDAAGDTMIDLHLDSRDATLEAAFAVIDTLDRLCAPVRVHCRGEIGGPAIGIVATADHRAAGPHTRFRLSQPRTQLAGTPDQIAGRSRQQQDLLWRLHARVARITGRPPEEIAEDMRRGRYLDAREAVDYGLIETITTPGAD